MDYQVNIETSWIIGFWSADRGSTAKGVVAVNNKNGELLKTFVSYSLKNFDITSEKLRERVIHGYGETKEVYFTRLPARKFIESVLIDILRLSTPNKLAYLAGRFDGDGTVDHKRSILCYYYSKKEKDSLLTDMDIIEKMGFKTSWGTCGTKALRLRVLRPRFFANKIIQYVRHPEKRNKLRILIKKRHYGA